MKKVPIGEHRQDFQVVAGTARSQAAVMILQPGEETGGPDNRHEDSDQWLYVVAGEGGAGVGGGTRALEAGGRRGVEAGEGHEVRGRGEEPLVTVNVYAPPAY